MLLLIRFKLLCRGSKIANWTISPMNDSFFIGQISATCDSGEILSSPTVGFNGTNATECASTLHPPVHVSDNGNYTIRCVSWSSIFWEAWSPGVSSWKNNPLHMYKEGNIFGNNEKWCGGCIISWSSSATSAALPCQVQSESFWHWSIPNGFEVWLPQLPDFNYLIFIDFLTAYLCGALIMRRRMTYSSTYVVQSFQGVGANVASEIQTAFSCRGNTVAIGLGARSACLGVTDLKVSLPSPFPPVWARCHTYLARLNIIGVLLVFTETLAICISYWNSTWAAYADGEVSLFSLQSALRPSTCTRKSALYVKTWHSWHPSMWRKAIMTELGKEAGCSWISWNDVSLDTGNLWSPIQPKQSKQNRYSSVLVSCSCIILETKET